MEIIVKATPFKVRRPEYGLSSPVTGKLSPNLESTASVDSILVNNFSTLVQRRKRSSSLSLLCGQEQIEICLLETEICAEMRLSRELRFETLGEAQ